MESRTIKVVVQNSFSIFNTYVMYELAYEENIKKQLGDVPIFPKNWYRIGDYNIKIEILKDAIINNMLIKDSEKFKTFIN